MTAAKASTGETRAERLALAVIRIETVLSRYPIHRLANKGTVSIDIRRKDERGATLHWTVDYANRHGQPGPLAYKLDTLIINRRIDDAGRPVPRVLRLGSLHEIARELGLDRNTAAVRKALLQNVGALINAKITYQAVDKSERSLEAVFSRYGVVFTGEKLPGGQQADGVYLILNEPYAEVLDAAIRRPLDYEYLKDLAPAPQRFYELLSYQMLPAVKYRQRAKLVYSEFCLYSTLTRYFEFAQVKKQMYKIHRPHLAAGYLAGVEYEPTVDADGRPDWLMFYHPGETARRQQRAFDVQTAAPPRPPAAPQTKNPRLGETLGQWFAPEPSALLTDGKGPADAADTRDDGVKAAIGKTPKETIGAKRAETSPGRGETDVEQKPAEELVRTFYRLRYGRDQDPTSRETAEAARFLAEGERWAHHLVEFAAGQGKGKNAFPNDFGGVKKLISQARGPFEARSAEETKARRQKARRSHETAFLSAYHAHLARLLREDLPASCPEALAAFTAQEESLLRFYRGRASTSARAAQAVARFHDESSRVARLVRFIEEDPRRGLPTFWQWDAQFNPARFQDEPT